MTWFLVCVCCYPLFFSSVTGALCLVLEGNCCFWEVCFMPVSLVFTSGRSHVKLWIPSTSDQIINHVSLLGKPTDQRVTKAGWGFLPVIASEAWRKRFKVFLWDRLVFVLVFMCHHVFGCLFFERDIQGAGDFLQGNVLRNRFGVGL